MFGFSIFVADVCRQRLTPVSDHCITSPPEEQQNQTQYNCILYFEYLLYPFFEFHCKGHFSCKADNFSLLIHTTISVLCCYVVSMATVEHLMFVQWGVGPNFNRLSPLLVSYCIIIRMPSSQVFLCNYLNEKTRLSQLLLALFV